MSTIKKVAAIHDISGVGRCSLTVIIPTLSTMGVQVCPVPTAVLSAHTGYSDFVMSDLTEFIPPALNHYKQLKMDFDCVYTGFLGSIKQIDYCLDFFNAFPNSLKVVDPVMGDDGKCYATYNAEMCRELKKLVSQADVITPNVTEAAILLDEEFPSQLSSAAAKSWLARLSVMGAKTVVITSVPMIDKGIYNIGYDKEHNSFWKVKISEVPFRCSGTGDMFASVLVGGILKGDSLPIAMNRATSFTELAVKTTYSYSAEPLDGIMFEPCLSWLSGYQVLREFTNL